MKLKSSEGESRKIGRFGIKADADRSDDVSAASRRSQLLSRESFRATRRSEKGLEICHAYHLIHRNVSG
jgi:hypothetical protein